MTEPLPPQVTLHNSIFQTSEESWMVAVWFHRLPDKVSAQDLSDQITQMIQSVYPLTLQPAPEEENAPD